MNVLIIDNYDSFTYNLYQFVGEILQTQLKDFSVSVKRNDDISARDIKASPPDRIIVSPGPGTPEDPAYFGECLTIIQECGQHIPLLGVCLGMQGIVHAFGGRIVHAPLPMHGKVSPISHDQDGVFKHIPQHIEIMRYHSLVADNALPPCLSVSAHVKDDDSIIMGVRHNEYPIEGIQFHPESFATEGGKEILRNFLLN